MTTNNNITLYSRVQKIYFKTENGAMLETYANAPKRIPKHVACGILQERGIEFKEVLKVQYEDIELNFTIAELNKILTD